MRIKYSLIDKLKNLTSTEMDLFLYIAKYQRLNGFVAGVHNQNVCKATGMCKQSFYTAMRGLERKEIVKISRTSDIDYDFLILGNDFTGDDAFKAGCEGYIDLSRSIFHKKQFKQLKAKEKWLLLYFLHCTHDNSSSYRIGTGNFYKNKEESMLQKRLVELSRLAYNRGIVIFSDFLNLNELNILHTTPKDMFLSQYKTYGGYDLSERQMAVFLPDALYYDYEYPIQIIEVTPSSKRFAENLTHRDYLGALMNLGIERSKVGDIIVEDQKGLIFVKEELAEYIADNLTVVRHTNVNTSIGKGVKVDYEPRFEELKGTVSSIRLDSVLALAYPLSRSKITAQIEAGKVFVNGKLITSNGYRLKDNDIISVRKMGRIAYDGILSETKKGRYLISVRKYI